MSDLRISYDDLSTCARDLERAGQAPTVTTVDGTVLGSSVVELALEDALRALDALAKALAGDVRTAQVSAQDAVVTLRAEDKNLAGAHR